MNRIVVWFALCLSFFAHSASAQNAAFDQLSVVPTAANPQSTLRARSLFQFCRQLEEIGKSSVTRSGNTLNLRIQMRPRQPGILCFATPPPPVPVFFELGQLEAGTYTLIQQPESSDPQTSYPALTTQITVAVAGPTTNTFSGLSVVPNPALAGQELQAQSTFNLCIVGEGLGPTQQSISGSVITLTLQMTGPTFCLGVPPPPRPVAIPIGSFAPGTYTLVQQPVSPNPNIVYPPLTTSFTVASAPLSVPASSTMSTLLLALLIGVGAYLGMLAGRED